MNDQTARGWKMKESMAITGYDRLRKMQEWKMQEMKMQERKMR